MEADHAWGGGVGLSGAGTGVLSEDQRQGCGEESQGLEELHRILLWCVGWRGRGE